MTASVDVGMFIASRFVSIDNDMGGRRGSN